MLIFGAGYRLGESRTQGTYTPRSALSFDMLSKVQRILEEKYVDQGALVRQQLMYGAVKGMVASLNDPYTFFLTPDENKESKNDLGGLYEGIGAQLGMRENRVIIVSPLKGSPAKEAGVLSGDYILKVDGKDTRGWSLQQAVNAIRGKRDTTVTLTLARDGKQVTVPIKRRQITVEPVEYHTQDGVGVLKVSQFGDQTNALWDKAVEQVEREYREKTITGLVLDLRSNPGGYLESAVYLASDFLPDGALVVRQEYANKDGKDYRANRTSRLRDIPIVVLIDEGSASASEILAGALRDHKRAKLIGMKTFGKGSVQEAIDLENGTGLHVTVAKWILPEGEWINKKGITPDITVKNEVKEGNTITQDSDAQLQRAIKELQ